MKRNPAAQKDSREKAAGKLYIVGTPIGNLEDITLRALRTLKECALIACEDTRQTRKLLNHFEIKTPTVSYHRHNENARAAELLDRLLAGTDVALVTDAGTPLVSDPGYRLVELCVASGIEVVPVPGASAALAAVVASGLPTQAFQFVGFPPAKGAARRRFWEQVRGWPATTILFEAPHRVTATLAEMLDVLGDRRAVLAREMTKLHEEFLRGRLSELLVQLRERAIIKGEITLLIGPPDREPPAEALPPIHERVEELVRQGTSRMEALKTVARERNISKSQAYRDDQSGRGGR